jgi:hypothetical protein
VPLTNLSDPKINICLLHKIAFVAKQDIERQYYHRELSQCKERIHSLLEVAWPPPPTEQMEHEVRAPKHRMDAGVEDRGQRDDSPVHLNDTPVGIVNG